MRTQRRIALWLGIWLLLGTACLWGQARQEIQFPDIPGYQTLKCDLHMHTMFSDGNVWPIVRVDEAWRQGLDVIAITDHIEYQPHKKDVPTQHNRPYELAIGSAKQFNLIMPRGAEITRSTPPGHFNAIFLEDVDPLDTKDFLACVEQANKQDAFVFWNHQAWKGEEKGKWLDVHTTMFEKKWLHGMEVCNGDSYYPSAHKWCLEKNLTMLGNSDIHAPDLRRVSAPDDHRTMTLVFVKERSMDSLKEALKAGRTAVWFENQIIGRAEFLEPFFHASVSLSPCHHRYRDTVYCTMFNRSDIPLELQRTGKSGPRSINLPPHTTSLLKIGTKAKGDSLTLQYEVINYLIAPDTPLPVKLTVKLPN
jgi:3',5'-nucleoside bisphosphate phosphatase